MSYISGANKELNEIIKRKVENEGELEECDEEKMAVIDQIKLVLLNFYYLKFPKRNVCSQSINISSKFH